MEVDHEKQVVYTEPLSLSPRDAPSLLAAMLPSQENTAQRLTSPIVSTHLNTRNIAFERYRCSNNPLFCIPSLPHKFTNDYFFIYSRTWWGIFYPLTATLNIVKHPRNTITIINGRSFHRIFSSLSTKHSFL